MKDNAMNDREAEQEKKHFEKWLKSPGHREHKRFEDDEDVKQHRIDSTKKKFAKALPVKRRLFAIQNDRHWTLWPWRTMLLAFACFCWAVASFLKK